nr:hypothetical protein CFP56_54247 [Quercus suber]
MPTRLSQAPVAYASVSFVDPVTFTGLSTYPDLKDDDVVIAQLVPVGPVAPLVLSAKDPSTQNVVDPTTLDAPPS